MHNLILSKASVENLLAQWAIFSSNLEHYNANANVNENI